MTQINDFCVHWQQWELVYQQSTVNGMINHIIVNYPSPIIFTIISYNLRYIFYSTIELKPPYIFGWAPLNKMTMKEKPLWDMVH